MNEFLDTVNANKFSGIHVTELGSFHCVLMSGKSDNGLQITTKCQSDVCFGFFSGCFLF